MHTPSPSDWPHAPLDACSLVERPRPGAVAISHPSTVDEIIILTCYHLGLPPTLYYYTLTPQATPPLTPPPPPSSASLRLSCSKVPSSRTTKHIPIPVLPPELSEFSWTGKGYLDGSCYRPTDCVERGSLATVLTTFSRSTCISSLSRCDSSHHGLVPTFTSQSCPLRRTS